jgi:hypothetical protein
LTMILLAKIHLLNYGIVDDIIRRAVGDNFSCI